MPQISRLSRSRAIHDASVTSSCVLDFLVPGFNDSRLRKQHVHRREKRERGCAPSVTDVGIEAFFYTALSQVAQCNEHRTCNAVPNVYAKSSVGEAGPSRSRKRSSHNLVEHQNPDGKSVSTNRSSLSIMQGKSMHSTTSLRMRHHNEQYQVRAAVQDTRLRQRNRLQDAKQPQSLISNNTGLLPDQQSQECLYKTSRRGSSIDKDIIIKMAEPRGRLLRSDLVNYSRIFRGPSATDLLPDPYSRFRTTNSVVGAFSRLGASARNTERHLFFDERAHSRRLYHTRVSDSRSKQERFAEGSYLPSDFFNDISMMKKSSRTRAQSKSTSPGNEIAPDTNCERKGDDREAANIQPFEEQRESSIENMREQMKLLSSVRELEERLGVAKKRLSKSITAKEIIRGSTRSKKKQSQIVYSLTREDYKNLVDLYYYSHNSRFSPEATDNSPTPVVLNDYSFTLSSNFTPGSSGEETVNEDESYESPLKRIEEMLRDRQLREVATMQVFVDLLLDENSSNRALYDAYRQLPDPGVAYLPKGIIRLFLQRMSTPWTTSEKSMLRYLSLIDDMQRAQIAINVSEWSSAIYLAGRAFSSVTKQEVNKAFEIWSKMEREAGVKASHVTFNILFDIAVRSGSFALGETILREMHSRNLRLNRLGRVSLMYYHGLRKDGDGVRKAYRDFVEAGEIVDTLVLNCVIASLLNAQEPQAAEQVYARMKDMQSQLRRGVNKEDGETLYRHYPEPGGNTINLEMASNSLGRVLQKAPNLHKILPDLHQELQARMPLTPNHKTFRAMITYHATTSGDLDRITVLLEEMSEIFQIPLHTMIFQLLFKGFAFHGPVGGPQTAWSVKRLELCWNACRSAIKASRKSKPADPHLTAEQIASNKKNTWDPEVLASDYILPSTAEINAMPPHAPIPNVSPPLSRPPPRRLSGWSEFVLDLAAFPRERLKRLERFHSTMFDTEDIVQPHEKPGIHTYESPFFQSSAYTAPEPQLDREEGEYELPNPSSPGLLYSADDADSETNSGSESNEEDPPETPPADLIGTGHQVVATRALVCWLLRAYARNTKSRRKVEEVWGSVRKIYKPRDAMERESVIRVLRRCLRDCDREGGG